MVYIFQNSSCPRKGEHSQNWAEYTFNAPSNSSNTEMALMEPSIFLHNGYFNPQSIDISSSLRSGSMTNDRGKSNREFGRFMGGHLTQAPTKNVEVERRLASMVTTNRRTTTDMTKYVMEPKILNVHDMTNYLIPEESGWVRGGYSSRMIKHTNN
jgi:hypothetical protein